MFFFFLLERTCELKKCVDLVDKFFLLVVVGCIGAMYVYSLFIEQFYTSSCFFATNICTTSKISIRDTFRYFRKVSNALCKSISVLLRLTFMNFNRNLNDRKIQRKINWDSRRITIDFALRVSSFSRWNFYLTLSR